MTKIFNYVDTLSSFSFNVGCRSFQYCPVFCPVRVFLFYRHIFYFVKSLLEKIVSYILDFLSHIIYEYIAFEDSYQHTVGTYFK